MGMLGTYCKPRITACSLRRFFRRSPKTRADPPALSLTELPSTSQASLSAMLPSLQDLLQSLPKPAEVPSSTHAPQPSAEPL